MAWRYNSYAIIDDKIAIMDTIDKKKTEEWLANIDAVLSGRKLDYLAVPPAMFTSRQGKLQFDWRQEAGLSHHPAHGAGSLGIHQGVLEKIR